MLMFLGGGLARLSIPQTSALPTLLIDAELKNALLDNSDILSSWCFAGAMVSLELI